MGRFERRGLIAHGLVQNIKYIYSCKISHSRRIFGKHPKLRKKLILEDIKNGFNLFFENKNKKKTEIINSMFL